MRWRILICIANKATESLPRGTAFLLWLHISLSLGEANFCPLCFLKREHAKQNQSSQKKKKEVSRDDRIHSALLISVFKKGKEAREQRIVQAKKAQEHRETG